MSNIRTVYSFNASDRSVASYSAKLKAPLEVGKINALKKGILKGLFITCVYATMPLIFWFGGVQVQDAGYEGGSVFTVLASLLFVVEAMEKVGNCMPEISPVSKATQHIHELATAKPMLPDPENGIELEAAHVLGAVELKDVDFAYPTAPDRMVLNHVSLKVAAGSRAAIVGESGSGKSTIVSLLLRYYDPSSGKILLDGQDMRSIKPESLRSVFGIVSQEPVLFGASIGDNIAYGTVAATRNDVEEAAKGAQIHDFILSLPDGYDTLVGEKGTQMSGGQKQRIAIARTIIRKPKVIVLGKLILRENFRKMKFCFPFNFFDKIYSAVYYGV